jgi:hypothetical protein
LPVVAFLRTKYRAIHSSLRARNAAASAASFSPNRHAVAVSHQGHIASIPPAIGRRLQALRAIRVAAPCDIQHSRVAEFTRYEKRRSAIGDGVVPKRVRPTPSSAASPRSPRVAGRSSLLRAVGDRVKVGLTTALSPVRFRFASSSRRGSPPGRVTALSERFLIGHRHSGLSPRIRSEASSMAIRHRHRVAGRPPRDREPFAQRDA